MAVQKNAPEDQMLPALRQDLTVTLKRPSGGEKVYVVGDPVSGEAYEFDEKSFFLCQLFDGLSRPDQIARKYSAFFGQSITREELTQFLTQIRDLHLLNEDANKNTATESKSHIAVRNVTHSALNNGAPNNRDEIDAQDGTSSNEELDEEPDWNNTRGNTNSYQWSLFNPHKLFLLLKTATQPLRVLFLLLTAGLVPGLVIAFFTYGNNQHLLHQDLALLQDARAYIGHLIFTLFAISLTRCLVQGVLITRYGGSVREFGIRLRFGIIPRFYIDKHAVREFDRHGKLWTYGANLLLRLFLFVFGILVWFWFRGTGSQLAANAIIIAQAGLFTFLIVSLPIRNADGYRWLTTYFRLPPTLLRTSLEIFTRMITGRPLPTSIPAGKRWRFFSYALLLAVVWSLIFVKVTTHIAAGMTQSFPDIFGHATEALILLLVIGLILRWVWWKFSQISGKQESAEDAFALPVEEKKTLTEKRLKMLLITAVVLGILIIPYPYRPGGEVTLLPPKQQNIQAPVSGKIVEVFFSGGDGKWIARGEIVARMISSELENEIRVLKERIEQQAAEVEKRHVQLAKLLAGPRPEEIAEVKARLERAVAQVEVARRQLDTAVVAAKFSVRELSLVQQLGDSIAALTVEQTRKQMN
ncbi:MAG: hypothetical protein HKP13_02065, partial [Gammaproteobacteria bacterium]|nr:hypothetical protein [Gammaproteobacteria bacterium]